MVTILHEAVAASAVPTARHILGKNRKERGETW
jgi:hypothetical protein